MKPNKPLQHDIARLRELRGSDREAYKKFFDELTKKHSISRQAVYRLMDEKPGPAQNKRKFLPHMVKISKKELDHLAGLIVEGKKYSETLAEMSRFKGFDYTPGRLATARLKLQLAAEEINGTRHKVVHHVYDPKTLDGLKISKVAFIRADGREGKTPKKPQLPKFTGDASKLFYALAKIDIKEPDTIHKLEFAGTVHYVHTSVIRECLDRIAASSLSGGGTISSYIKFALESLLVRQLIKSRDRGYITSVELSQFTTVQKRLLSFSNGDPAAKRGYYTFDEVMHIVSVFSPSATREKVANIIASHPFLCRHNPGGEGVEITAAETVN